MWAAVFATSPATITLKCGGSSSTFSAPAGVTTLKIPLSPGKMTVQMARSGQTIIDYTPSDYAYITNPVLCEFAMTRCFRHAAVLMILLRQL